MRWAVRDGGGAAGNGVGLGIVDCCSRDGFVVLSALELGIGDGNQARRKSELAEGLHGGCVRSRYAIVSILCLEAKVREGEIQLREKGKQHTRNK